jgi:predicted O-linked N-acetylglucosamine transferase (SPINDLY family)
MNNKKDLNQLLIEALDIHNQKNYEVAKKKYQKILEFDSENFDANNLLGVLFIETKDFCNAEKYLSKSIKIDPKNWNAHSNLGIVLNEQNNFDKAINLFDQAIELNANYAEAYNNRGLVYLKLNKDNEAINDFNKAILIKSDFVFAYNNLAVSYLKLNKNEAALINCNISLSVKFNLEALLIRADIYFKERKYTEAIKDFSEAIKLKKNIGDKLLKYIFSKKIIAEWENLENLIENFVSNLEQSKYSGDSFFALSILECPVKLKTYSKLNSKNFFQFLKPTLKEKFNYKKHNKIHLGYFSSDFRDHAISHLITGLLEKHNKEDFVVYAFSLSEPKEKDTYTKRISNALNLIDISCKSLNEIQNICKKFEIDIGIDLNGFTNGAKPEIFFNKIAPIQINYLGFPGTLGPDLADYIIADSKIIQKDIENCYFEKIIYLPNSYQVNDDNQKICAKKFTRKELNLPEEDFIFCCFNSSYKISEKIFSSWMRILNSINNSVLWFLEENQITRQNLIKEANKFGIHQNRLIFTKNIPIEEHLSRIKNADLFLDTYPYGAHTTAKDFLYSGVPVLTIKGTAFQSNVAFSLLSVLNLEKDLVANNITEYEEFAKKIANNKELYKNIKNQLTDNKIRKKLFDTQLFTTNIETAYKLIYDQYLKKIDPKSIYI